MLMGACQLRWLCAMRTAVLTLWVIGADAAVREPKPEDSQMGARMTDWHSKLRADILSGAIRSKPGHKAYEPGFDMKYDKNSPPRSNRIQYSDPNGDNPYSVGAVYSDAGADVKLQLRVFKLDSIDINSGSLQVKVWVRMQWVDERLAWNSSEYGGLHTVRVRNPPFEMPIPHQAPSPHAALI